MDKNIFEFKRYKHYLTAIAGTKVVRRGVKAALAAAAGCQPSYFSQVLYGKSHLSLEQADRISRHLKHSDDESEFFLILVNFERAGTTELRAHYSKQMERSLERRLKLTARFESKNTLSEENKQKYYSSWTYAGIHIATTIPALQTSEALAEYFRLPVRMIKQCLDFLMESGLIIFEKGRYKNSENSIRLGNDSHLILRHHTNWRLQAIDSLEGERPKDFHYSSVITLSEIDVIRIKESLLSAVQSTKEIVLNSPAEKVYTFNIDFFSLRKT